MLFAEWLIDALDNFVNRQALNYLGNIGGFSQSTGRRQQIAARHQGDLFGGSVGGAVAHRETSGQRSERARSFAMGVCHRITERLIELATEESRDRRQAAKRRLEADGMGFQKGKGSNPSIGNSSAFRAGMAAGEQANFHRPVTSGAAQRCIAA